MSEQGASGSGRASDNRAPSRALSVCATLARLMAAVLCCWLLCAPASQAQNTGGFPGFLQSLFGGGAKPQAPPSTNAPLRVRAHKPRKSQQDFVASTVTRAPGSPGGAPNKPTFFVSVLGDSLGILTAQGLSEAFADKPEILISSLARDNSGLTRDDYFDWPKTARALASATPKVDVVVIMLGINDVQPLKDGADMVDPLSDRWRAAYAARIESLVAPFQEAHIPVFWVGLPPMQDERFNAQAIALNEIFREHAEKAGAKYIDIWDGFADQSGRFAAFGPDVEGQNAKLRSGPNGIYFTKMGSRKVAQFLEPEIRRIFDKGRSDGDIAALPPDIEQQADDINAEIRREMGVGPSPAGGAPEPRSTPGPILSLTARPVSPAGALVGSPGMSPPSGQSIALRSGDAPGPRAGRADSFPWPPHE